MYTYLLKLFSYNIIQTTLLDKNTYVFIKSVYIGFNMYAYIHAPTKSGITHSDAILLIACLPNVNARNYICIQHGGHAIIPSCTLI